MLRGHLGPPRCPEATLGPGVGWLTFTSLGCWLVGGASGASRQAWSPGLEGGGSPLHPPLWDPCVGNGPAFNQVTGCLIKLLTLLVLGGGCWEGRCGRLSGVPLPSCPRKGMLSALSAQQLGRRVTPERSGVWDIPSSTAAAGPGAGARPHRPDPWTLFPSRLAPGGGRGGFLVGEGPRGW